MLVLVSGYSQKRFGVGVSSGFNRIGLYFDAGPDLNFNAHQVHAGIKYYGPDFVFESDVIGLSLGYNYAFYSGRWFFGPGLSTSFFREKKSTNEIFLAEILLRNIFGFEFGERFSVYSALGLGTVINRHSNYTFNSTSSTSYINYEFSLGVKYYLRIPSDN